MKLLIFAMVLPFVACDECPVGCVPMECLDGGTYVPSIGIYDSIKNISVWYLIGIE